MADTFYATLELKILGWKVCCSVFWGNMNKTRYSATEFGGNKPMNCRLSGTLNQTEVARNKPLISPSTLAFSVIYTVRNAMRLPFFLVFIIMIKRVCLHDLHSETKKLNGR